MQDVQRSTLALVLQCASACRLVLPRRFEDVPLWIPEPDESTGGLPYRGGATFLEPAVLNWILLNRPKGELVFNSNDSRRLHPRSSRGETHALNERCEGRQETVSVSAHLVVPCEQQEADSFFVR